MREDTSQPGQEPPLLSVVVPTFNEEENVALIAARIRAVLEPAPYEIVFVDDSTDRTPLVLAGLSGQDSSVRFEHRESGRGLGTAVVRGIDLARGKFVAVMDADLQHPPETLTEMLAAVQTGADIVIPSRFAPGGDDGGLSPFRKLVSLVARMTAKVALRRLRRISDPTGGFFMFRRSVVAGVRLQPIGWKILIEVLARGRYSSVIEIPYRFQPRNAGVSKLSLDEEWNYLRHLLLLAASSPDDRRFFLFAAIGATGILVNLTVYDILVRAAVPVALAGLGAGGVAMLWNFALNNNITWREAPAQSIVLRLPKYIAVSLVATGIDVAVLSGLYYPLHINYLLANLTGILVGMFWNYWGNNRWTWSGTDEQSRLPAVTAAAAPATTQRG